jgi:regulator of RNase E activity RraA
MRPISVQSDNKHDLARWGGPHRRPEPELIRRFDTVSSATACAKLSRLGISRTFINGPRPDRPGARAVGPARTLQFMPQREDIASGAGEEYVERRTALWAVLDAAQPGDVLVVQAEAATHTGCLGEMLVRYFGGRGGAGIVVDGRTRDSGKTRALDVPMWTTGATPHYASQGELFPWAYDVPVSVGGVLVMPGDLIVADDDGAVVVPQGLAGQVLAASEQHEEWEAFSRERLAQGGALSRYYPLDDSARAEYEQWRDAANRKDPQ